MYIVATFNWELKKSNEKSSIGMNLQRAKKQNESQRLKLTWGKKAAVTICWSLMLLQ